MFSGKDPPYEGEEGREERGSRSSHRNRSPVKKRVVPPWAAAIWATSFSPVPWAAPPSGAREAGDEAGGPEAGSPLST